MLKRGNYDPNSTSIRRRKKIRFHIKSQPNTEPERKGEKSVRSVNSQLPPEQKKRRKEKRTCPTERKEGGSRSMKKERGTHVMSRISLNKRGKRKGKLLLPSTGTSEKKEKEKRFGFSCPEDRSSDLEGKKGRKGIPFLWAQAKGGLRKRGGRG